MLPSTYFPINIVCLVNASNVSPYIAASGNVNIGNAIPSQPVDYDYEGQVILTNKLQYSGEMTSWKAHFRAAGIVVFQIWRPANYMERKYKLIAEYTYTSPGSGQSKEVRRP